MSAFKVYCISLLDEDELYWGILIKNLNLDDGYYCSICGDISIQLVKALILKLHDFM